MNIPRLTLGVAASLLDDVQVFGDAEAALASLTCDSRDVVPGGLFAAIEGTQFDGHRFIDAAIEAGAVDHVVPLLRIPEVLLKAAATRSSGAKSAA